jgi:hypothetical protein
MGRSDGKECAEPYYDSEFDGELCPKCLGCSYEMTTVGCSHNAIRCKCGWRGCECELVSRTVIPAQRIEA